MAVLLTAAGTALGAGGIAGAASSTPQNLSAEWRGVEVTGVSGVTWVGEVALSWQPPDGGAGAAVSGYEYRYFPAEHSAPDNWTSLSANARTLTLGGLSDEVAYRFELRARTAGDPGAKATVDFMPLAPREGDIRFADGFEHDGPIEVFIDGEWGKVCDRSFRHQGAVVACRQLGYATGSHRYINSEAEALDDTLFVMNDVHLHRLRKPFGRVRPYDL